MLGRRSIIAAATVLACVAGPGGAQTAAPATAVLDDSGTMVGIPSLRMRWRDPVPGRSFDNNVAGSTPVSVHLATAAWAGRRARIFMALARGTGPDIRADWTSGGTMLAGSTTSGGRALVYAGMIGAAAMTDTLQVTLTTDGRQLTVPVALDFQFQIEVER